MGRVADFFADNRITLDGQKQAKMVSLDRKCEDIEAERDRLKAENLHLQSEVNPLKREVDRLKEQIKEQTAPSMSLDETEQTILEALSKFPRTETDKIANALKLSPEAALFHLNELRNMKFVDYNYDMGDQVWYLRQDGRAYLHRKGLLK